MLWGRFPGIMVYTDSSFKVQYFSTIFTSSRFSCHPLSRVWNAEWMVNMALPDFYLIKLQRGNMSAILISQVNPALSSLAREGMTESFICFGSWRALSCFILATVSLTKIQLHIRMRLVQPQRDTGYFRYEFEGDLISSWRSTSYPCRMLFFPWRNRLWDQDRIRNRISR